MPDEIIISDSSTGAPRFRVTVEDDRTVIRDYATNAPRFVLDGEIGGGGVEVMTTDERTAITPAQGELILDTDDGLLYVGDGETPGGNVVSGGGGGGDISYATVKDMMTGSGASKALNVKTLRGALTSGKAVDVTSKPDGFDNDNYRGTFTWNGSTLGFASFPKFASGLKYMLIADIIYSSSMDDDSGSVTPYGGTWPDGTTSPITLEAGKKTRVAILFSSASVRFQFVYAVENDQIIVSNLREYEVTGCSTESVSYISTIEDPDSNYSDFYLIDTDEVNPWVPYIDMGTSPQVTIASGLSYKLNAQTGVHTLSVDSFPANTYGRDSHIELWVGAEGSVVFAPPLNLLSPLTPNAVHNITVKFRDGQANAYVDDTDVGYVVTVTSGFSVGSLYYGLVNSGTHVVFAASTDGVLAGMNEATVTSEKRVIGNGYSSTFVSGEVIVSANLYLTNLTLDGGTISIASGATATFENGTFAPNIVSGGGKLAFGENATLDLTDNTSSAPVAPTGGIVFNGATDVIYGASGATTTASITGGTFAQIASGGSMVAAGVVYTQTSGSFSASNLSFLRSLSAAGMLTFSGGTATLVGCSGGDMKNGRYLEIGSAASVLVSDCQTDGGAQYAFIASGGTLTLAGSNFIGRGVGKVGAVSGGSLVILDGATINESGGFIAIEPGLGITFGANVTVINNTGTSSLLNGGSSGTCTKINTNGTIA